MRNDKGIYKRIRNDDTLHAFDGVCGVYRTLDKVALYKVHKRYDKKRGCEDLREGGRAVIQKSSRRGKV